MKRTKSKKTGAARMMELGKHPVQIFLNQAQHDALREAADLEGRDMAGFVRWHSMNAVRRVLHPAERVQ